MKAQVLCQAFYARNLYLIILPYVSSRVQSAACGSDNRLHRMPSCSHVYLLLLQTVVGFFPRRKEFSCLKNSLVVDYAAREMGIKSPRAIYNTRAYIFDKRPICVVDNAPNFLIFSR